MFHAVDGLPLVLQQRYCSSHSDTQKMDIAQTYAPSQKFGATSSCNGFPFISVTIYLCCHFENVTL